MANDQQDIRATTLKQGYFSSPVMTGLVIALILVVLYVVGSAMWAGPNTVTTTTGSVGQSQPSTTPPVVAPPVVPSQQGTPPQPSPQPVPPANPSRSGGG